LARGAKPANACISHLFLGNTPAQPCGVAISKICLIKLKNCHNSGKSLVLKLDEEFYKLTFENSEFAQHDIQQCKKFDRLST
jgi:hypothetical protein